MYNIHVQFYYYDMYHKFCARVGSAVPVCGDEPINLGLWIDALNFIVVSLQIIIFDTQHAEVVKNELTTKVNQSES